MYTQLENLALLQLKTLNKLLEINPNDYDIKKIVKETIEGLEHLGAKVRLVENNVLTLIQVEEMIPHSRL